LPVETQSPGNTTPDKLRPANLNWLLDKTALDRGSRTNRPRYPPLATPTPIHRALLSKVGLYPHTAGIRGHAARLPALGRSRRRYVLCARLKIAYFRHRNGVLRVFDPLELHL